MSDDGQNVRVAEMTCGTCARKASYYCDVTTWAVGDGDECSVPPEFGGMSWEPRMGWFRSGGLHELLHKCERCGLAVFR